MSSACFCTPESTDSAGNGTRMRPASDLPNTGLAGPSVASYCHRPLRFFHRGCASEGRASCGRGYSGKALCGDTSAVHGVASGACRPLQVVAPSDADATAGIVPAIEMAASATHAMAQPRALAVSVIDPLPLPCERAGRAGAFAEGGQLSYKKPAPGHAIEHPREALPPGSRQSALADAFRCVQGDRPTFAR